MSAQDQAEYLTHFRADSIVRDAEAIRQELGVEKWSVLGQSFGGFCVVNYLSQAPEGLAEALVTGGLPAARAAPGRRLPRDLRADARRRTTPTTSAIPRIESACASIVERLETEDVRLPSGDRLTGGASARSGTCSG